MTFADEPPTSRVLDATQRQIFREVCYSITTAERADLLRLQGAWLALDADGRVLINALAQRLKPRPAT